VDPLTHRRLGISDSLLDAVKGITEKKKLDPVGKADADIDNDGDVDKSDEYLKNRRKAIKKSMKKDDKKPSGKKDQVDLEPELDDKMNESRLIEQTAGQTGKDHFYGDEEETVGAQSYKENKPLEKGLRHVFKLEKQGKVKVNYRDNRGDHTDGNTKTKAHRKPDITVHYDHNTDDFHGYTVHHDGNQAHNKELHKPQIHQESFNGGLNEESIKITYRNPKDGKTHTMNVFTAQDARQAEMDLKRQGMMIIKKEMGEEKSPDGVDKGAVDKHNCATHVYHEQWGEGQTIRTMHAEPDEHGFVEWYDVMFDHGIEKGVPVAEMKVTLEMSHGNHKKKK